MLTKMWITGFMLAVAGFGQPAGLPSFEVASVKVDTNGTSSPDGPHGPGRPNIKSSPASVTMINVSLKAAVGWAYHVYPYQVNGPGWLDSGHYDILAKAPAAVSEDQLRQMLQRLLAERFKVELHRETKEMGAYVVVVDKGGIKFQESQSEGDPEMKPNGQFALNLKRVTMEQLADQIAYSPIPDPVVDQTGLKGKYDITLDISKFAQTMGQPSGIDEVIMILSKAIQEQLGLKIEHHKVPIELLIVDHAEKVPVEN